MVNVNLLLSFLILIFAFLTTALGANLVVNSIKKVSRQFKIPPFLVSFLLIGFLGTLPEINVGLNAIASNKPDIYMGNLIGGVILILLLIIPLYAIAAKELELKKSVITRTNLIFTLLVIITPSILIVDGIISFHEAILMISMYIFLILNIYKAPGIYENITNFVTGKINTKKHTIKIVLGLVLIIISSKIIVDKTIDITNTLNIGTFIFSLIILSIGTNMPEISLAVASLLKNTKEIALGSYLGSAAFNTFSFGVLSILNTSSPYTEKNYSIATVFSVVAVVVFYYFIKSHNKLTRKEGFFLIFIYFVFAITELFSGNFKP